MPTYIVTKSFTMTFAWKVKAKGEDEARKKFYCGGGSAIDGYPRESCEVIVAKEYEPLSECSPTLGTSPAA